MEETGKGKALLVDDEPNALAVYSGLLKDWGYETVTAGGTIEAMEILRADPGITMSMVDLRMPSPDGMALFRWIKANHPGVPVIILTAYGSIASAVEAIAEGAFHYLAKPPEPEQLKSILDKARSHVAMSREIALLKERLEEVTGSSEEMLVGQSAAFKKCLDLAGAVAASEASVLLLGETGTGKEMLARMIHRGSRRAAGAFVGLNCGALPPTLLESELFGHEKGAFTGALAAREGKFEAADGGTVFLDEVGDCSPELQVKLLRVLEEKAFCRLGSNKIVSSDFRLVAATNRNLGAAVKEGTFREDLYFRINVFEISLPPLRERPEDLPLLAWHFLRKAARNEGHAVEGLDPRALECLMAHTWPGNIRELENVMHRAVILAGGPTVTEAHLPPHLRSRPWSVEGAPDAGCLPSMTGKTIAQCERILIRSTLSSCGGNKSHAARMLGISRKVLYSKIGQYGL